MGGCLLVRSAGNMAELSNGDPCEVERAWRWKDEVLKLQSCVRPGERKDPSRPTPEPGLVPRRHFSSSMGEGARDV